MYGMLEAKMEAACKSGKFLLSPTTSSVKHHTWRKQCDLHTHMSADSKMQITSCGCIIMLIWHSCTFDCIMWKSSHDKLVKNAANPICGNNWFYYLWLKLWLNKKKFFQRFFVGEFFLLGIEGPRIEGAVCCTDCKRPLRQIVICDTRLFE